MKLMENNVLMPLDTFTIINRTILHNSDRKNLIMLYQPIVGSNAINLYFTFWMYLDRLEFMTETITFKQLINYMDLSLSEIEQARKYLEAVGLIKTLIKKSEVNEYLIELYSPKPASEYFINPLLCTALHTALGTADFNKTKSAFRIPKLDFKDYINVSVNFQDMFQTTASATVDNSDMRKRNFERIGVRSKLDIDSLLLKIPDINSNHIEVDENIKRHILILSFLYNYNESILIQLIKNSIVKKSYLDKQRLTDNFLNYYRFEHDNKVPMIIKKIQPKNLTKDITSSDKKSKLIYYFENIDPISHLCKRTKVKRLSDVYITMLNHILLDIELNPGVINVLIDYVLSINNNNITKNFVESIANNWKRNDIITVEQAYDYVVNQKKEKTNLKTNKTNNIKLKKIEQTPSWFDKDMTIENDENSKNELDELISGLR